MYNINENISTAANIKATLPRLENAVSKALKASEALKEKITKAYEKYLEYAKAAEQNSANYAITYPKLNEAIDAIEKAEKTLENAQDILRKVNTYLRSDAE